MLKRLLTSIILILIFVPCTLMGSFPYMAMASFITYFAGYEMMKVLGNNEGCYKRLKYMIPLWNLLTLWTWFIEGEIVFYIIIMSVLLILSLGILQPRFTVYNIGHMLFSYLYTGVILSMALMLRKPLPQMNNLFDFSRAFYLFSLLVIVVVATDTGAYLIGSLIGKHRLCPNISPKKSVEGAISGSIVGVLLGAVWIILSSKYFYQMPLLWSLDQKWLTIFVNIIFLVVISVASQIGDLIASKIKRHCGVKDYSNLMPGHGGIIDRFDSLMFAGAIFVCIIAIYL